MLSLGLAAPLHAQPEGCTPTHPSLYDGKVICITCRVTFCTEHSLSAEMLQGTKLWHIFGLSIARKGSVSQETRTDVIPSREGLEVILTCKTREHFKKT